jgi:hypothetical protein
VTGGLPEDVLEGRDDGAALRVAQDDHQPGPEPGRRELHAADLRRRDDVAGDADDEEIAESLVEDELRGNP